MTSSRFSLTHGGLLFRLERRFGLIDDLRHGIRNRVIVFLCLTWVPIVILELIRVRFAPGGAPGYVLYSDLGMNVRLLFAGPLLILAEVIVDRRIPMAIDQFESRGILKDPKELAPTLAKVRRQVSGIPGVIAELVLAMLVIVWSLDGFERTGPGRDWMLMSQPPAIPASLRWYVWVAIPLLQFLQFRWLWRFAAWLRLLWGVSKLRLNPIATHPDLAGGLSFIAFAQETFALLWIATSAAAASSIPLRLESLGKTLEAYYPAIGALVAAEALLLIAPLVLFIPHLVVAKDLGLMAYGTLSSEYIGRFDSKWVVAAGPKEKDDSLLGTSDIQSLADIGNGYERVHKMRVFPADRTTFARIFLAGLLPFLPLVFLEVPITRVLQAMLKLVM